MKRSRIVPATKTSQKSSFATNEGDKDAALPTMGVGIGLLKNMRDAIKADNPENYHTFTVDEVLEKYIKTWMEGANLSFVQHMKDKYSLDIHPTLQASYYSEYFAEATVYVSYTRRFTFEGLVEALVNYESNHNMAALVEQEDAERNLNGITIVKDRKIYFWLDILVLNQSVRLNESKLNLETFKSFIGKIGETVLVAMPWHGAHPFRRTWCLFEILATHESGAKLSLQFSRTRHSKMLSLLAENYETAMTQMHLETIDVESSEASNERERLVLMEIFARLEDGYHHANDVISYAVKQWCYQTAVREIRQKLKKDIELRMTERIEKHRKVSVRELFCFAFGCVAPHIDLTVLDPVDRDRFILQEQGVMKLRLAALMNELKHYDEAELLYVEALAANEKMHFGPEHPSSLSVRGNLALLYKTQKRYQESEELFQAVLETKEKCLGSAHPSTLLTMQNLASLWKEMGNTEGAIELFNKSLSEQIHELGESHPDTLVSMEHLAQLYLDCGRLLDAKAMLERLLQLKEGLYGEKNKETAVTYETTGALYVKEGMLEEACELFRKALTAREGLFGANHPTTIATVLRLACVQKSRKVLPEAVELFHRVLAQTESTCGPLHIACFNVIEHIADVLTMQGELERAEALLEELLTKKEDLLGVLALSTLTTKFQLAEVSAKLKKYVIAETNHRTVLQWRLELLGELHKDTAASMHGLATCLVYLKQVDEGKQLYERALVIFDAIDPVQNNANSLSTADCLATICKITGDVQQAEDLLSRLKLHYKTTLGANHPITIGFAKRITALLQSSSTMK